MNIFKRMLLILGISAAIRVLALAGVLGFAAYRKVHYADFVETGGPIEATYTPMGPSKSLTRNSTREVPPRRRTRSGFQAN